MFSKLSCWSSTLPWTMTSAGVSSLMRKGGPMHAEIEDKTFYFASISWDALEYNIHES
jgi:hypothetical protein